MARPVAILLGFDGSIIRPMLEESLFLPLAYRDIELLPRPDRRADDQAAPGHLSTTQRDQTQAVLDRFSHNGRRPQCSETFGRTLKKRIRDRRSKPGSIHVYCADSHLINLSEMEELDYRLEQLRQEGHIVHAPLFNIARAQYLELTSELARVVQTPATQSAPSFSNLGIGEDAPLVLAFDRAHVNIGRVLRHLGGSEGRVSEVITIPLDRSMKRGTREECIVSCHTKPGGLVYGTGVFGELGVDAKRHFPVGRRWVAPDFIHAFGKLHAALHQDRVQANGASHAM